MPDFFKTRTNFPYIILAIVGVLVYANMLSNAMFWDDYDFILNNQFVRNFDIGHIFTENIIAGAGFVSNYFRPILSLIFALEWHFFGNWTIGYHFISLIFHIANGLLLFNIFKKIFNRTLIPFFVSLIFLIHPLQVEAVAYANSLGDSLSVFLMFLAIFFYLKTNLLLSDSNRLRNYFLALFLFILALLSKETAIVLPALLLMIEWLSYESTKKYESAKNYFLKLLPFFIIAGIYMYLRGTIWNFDNTFNFYDKPDAYTESILVRIFTFFKVLTTYFSLLILPVKLHYERTIEMSRSLLDLQTFIGFGILITLFAIAITTFIKKRKLELLFALAWFLIGLAPASGILIPINNYLYEHWLYLPLIGFFLFWGFIVKDINLKLKSIVAIPLLIFLIFLSIQTIKRNAEWRNPINFYLQTLEFTPESGRAWNNLGTEYAKIKEYEKAKNAYLKSIEFVPQNPGPYNNVGNIFAVLSKLDTAAEYWRKSVELNPDFLPPREALRQYYEIKKLAPDTKIKIKL